MNKSDLSHLREQSDWTGKRTMKKNDFLLIIDTPPKVSHEVDAIALQKIILNGTRAPREGMKLSVHYDKDAMRHVFGTVEVVYGTANLGLDYSWVVKFGLNDPDDFSKLYGSPGWEKVPKKTKTPAEIAARLRELGPLPPLPIHRGRGPDIKLQVKVPSDTNDEKVDGPKTIGTVIPDDAH